MAKVGLPYDGEMRLCQIWLARGDAATSFASRTGDHSVAQTFGYARRRIVATE
jgi:hypothetical protein